MRFDSAVSALAVAGLTAAVVLVSSEPAQAQGAKQAAHANRSDAEQLYQKAQHVEAADDRSMQLTAAWLYRQAARVLPEDAEKRYRSLWRAAHLYLQHGRAAKAAPLLAEAGRQARQNGHPERAATCYLRLARLAAEAGDGRRAWSVLQTVRPLLENEALKAKKRKQLRTMAANVRTMITELAESS